MVIGTVKTFNVELIPLAPLKEISCISQFGDATSHEHLQYPKDVTPASVNSYCGSR